MTDYYEEKKNVQKKEKESSLWTQQKVGFQDKENEKEKVLTDPKNTHNQLTTNSDSPQTSNFDYLE